MKKLIKTLFITLAAVIISSLSAFASEKENTSSDFKTELQAVIEKYNANGELSEEEVQKMVKEIMENDDEEIEEIQEKDEERNEIEEKIEILDIIILISLFIILMLVIIVLL
jgi:polyhydroxyalkanoate synthesis regulator phasin